MTNTSKETTALCQNCGGKVDLEVDFAEFGEGFSLYASCRDCNRGAWNHGKTGPSI